MKVLFALFTIAKLKKKKKRIGQTCFPLAGEKGNCMSLFFSWKKT